MNRYSRANPANELNALAATTADPETKALLQILALSEQDVAAGRVSPQKKL